METICEEMTKRIIGHNERMNWTQLLSIKKKCQKHARLYTTFASQTFYPGTTKATLPVVASGFFVLQFCTSPLFFGFMK